MALNGIVVVLYVIDILYYTIIDDSWGVGREYAKTSYYNLYQIKFWAFVRQNKTISTRSSSVLSIIGKEFNYGEPNSFLNTAYSDIIQDTICPLLFVWSTREE